MGTNYEKLLERISRISGLNREELERKIEAKRAKLAGLITKEGAAQVVAAELGISLGEERLKINELVPGMRKVNVLGKIIRIFPVRSFTRNGKSNRVASFVLADDTSNVRVVLWDSHHIDLIEKGEISEGSVIEIVNASMRDNEIHLGSFSEIKKSAEVLENIVTAKIVKEKRISEFRPNESVKTRAFVVQSFEPRFFYVCPECKGRVEREEEGFVCKVHGRVAPEKRAVINLVLDDGTGTIRAVVFHDLLEKLGFQDLESFERVLDQRESLLGTEWIFSGDVRNNAFFNELEFVVSDIEPVDLDLVISELEKGDKNL